MRLSERLRFRTQLLRRRLGERRRRGWNGVSILILRGESAEAPLTLRINYYALAFAGALALVAPAAAIATIVERRVAQSERIRVAESRRSLLNLMSSLTREKERMIERAGEQSAEIRGISYAETDEGEAVNFPRPSAPDDGAPAADRLSYDLAISRRMNLLAGVTLRDQAYSALELVWHRMTLHHIMPRGRPLPAGAGSITSEFGSRPNPFQKSESGPREAHSGVDFASAAGTPIAATAPGIVIRSIEEGGGYGKHIRIHHGLGYTTLYAHCNELFVKQGEYVRRGQIIATLGRTGRTTGNHVHYEVELGADPQIDPMEYIQLR
ncbi:MAG: M23 family metallopeptidase [Leptospirales bacterium]|nr:M23 family metallopeptidase [Leptospirales bacterium]